MVGVTLFRIAGFDVFAHQVVYFAIFALICRQLKEISIFDQKLDVFANLSDIPLVSNPLSPITTIFSQ